MGEAKLEHGLFPFLLLESALSLGQNPAWPLSPEHLSAHRLCSVHCTFNTLGAERVWDS